MAFEKRENIAALVLAAGCSSRMGGFKPLLPLGRSTVVEEAVERIRRAGIEDVRVIAGHRADEIGPVIDRLGARKIVNTDYDSGMYPSILAGVKSLGPEIEAFFVLPVDTPLVKPATIAALAATCGNNAAGIVYPRFEGLRGHPPIISTQLAPNLPDHCEGGLAAFLGRHEAQAVDLDVIDQSVLMNSNTWLDYLKLKACGAREDIPTGRECIALLRERNVADKVVAHCRKVAEVALLLTVHLQAAGLALDFELVKAGGLLHDMAKGQHSDHAAAAEFLEKIGYSRVARIVALHTDIEPKGLQPLDESDVVHLADKLVTGDMLVSLEERFDGALKKFADRPEVLNRVERRPRDARAIKEQVESTLGAPLESLVQKCAKSLRAASSERRNIYLARHGAIQHPGDVKRYIGQTDLPLIAEGVRQAETLAEKLRHTRISAIFRSDLRRSIDTARIVGKLHGIEIAAIPRFREIALGQWEGMSVDAVRSKYPADYDLRGRNIAHFSAPGGESFMDCALRVTPAFYDAIYSTRGDILIVGHAGVNRVLLCRILGKPVSELFEIEQDYCCLNRILCCDFSFELESLNESFREA